MSARTTQTTVKRFKICVVVNFKPPCGEFSQLIKLTVKLLIHELQNRFTSVCLCSCQTSRNQRGFPSILSEDGCHYTTFEVDPQNNNINNAPIRQRTTTTLMIVTTVSRGEVLFDFCTTIAELKRKLHKLKLCYVRQASLRIS